VTEVYSQQANPAFEAALTQRTAAQEAAFFVPHLRPGMRVLDAGCGPGSITVDLAAIVAPGQVVGIDAQPSQVEQARVLASARGRANASFAVADAYRLPFADATFDAAFAHGMLMHLHDPLCALAELRRVLRAGGVIGIRDPDLGALLHMPTTPLLEQWLSLRVRVRQHNGGDPFIGRRHRALLQQAGFVAVEAGATVNSAGSQETLAHHGAFLQAQWVGIARTALAMGWIEPATVATTAAAIDDWTRRPDAFAATVWCHAVGHVQAP
jgi:ubiquinone/menaquinone biosynthesis C-methylase UbiE